MFTGIITDIGRVRAIERGVGDPRMEIETRFDTTGLAVGASIAHSGCCLTVVGAGAGWFAVEVSSETLARTNLGGWRPGARVNLERAARLGEEIGGHIVSGHVDGVGEVRSLRPEGGSHRLSIRAPRPLHRYIASQGSIAVDGVSLTVNGVEDDLFEVNVIPHTWGATTLADLQPGATVNLEIDMLARYAARWRETA